MVEWNTSNFFIIDSTIRDTVMQQINVMPARYFSVFNTPIEVRFFINNKQTDSIIEKEFHMYSWYSSHKDSIALVAHFGNLETIALLIRFTNKKPAVFFFRAPHEIGEGKYFRINQTDSFSETVEVPAATFEVKLSAIPDSLHRPLIFGYVNFKSKEYYDKRDSVEKKRQIQMRFYFRSQYRSFE